jgi:hypothetical protein
VVCSARAEEKSLPWAFKPPVRPIVPVVANSTWGRNPIDAFVLAKLQAARIVPAVEADRATLLRRVTFDLTGLLPTPEEVTAFQGDSRPDAYERVVERLLASPHYGERWAQHWLDLARFAESNGYEGDRERPHAWRYRDYVVRSLNADKPYDRFLTEQLAGDLLARGQKSPDPDLLVAVGFNRCGPIHQVGGNVDAVMLRQEFLTEVANSVGAVFLGLTMGCSRCHDHKFDPLTQTDYFRLQAFFAPVEVKEIDLAPDPEQEAHRKAIAEVNARIAPIRKQLDTLEAPYRQKLTEAKRAALEAKYREALDQPLLKRTPEQVQLALQAQPLLKITWDEVVAALTPEDRERRATWRRQMHDLEASKPAPPVQAWSLEEQKRPHKIPVLKRGDPHRPTQDVAAGYPKVLGGESGETFDRLALAKWLTQPEHPLTARVIVNRLWQHHFGRGIVATPSDFGVRGGQPSHPELLDWLATELVRQGWSLKALHRLMVTSATYRQASGNAGAENADPENVLLGRMNRKRMEAEGLRDCALQAGGGLLRQGYGTPVRVPLEPEVYDLIFTEDEPDNLWTPTQDVRQHDRRSLYLFAKRNVRLPLLEAFDQPDTLTVCPVRPVSTFAPQALQLLNGPFLRQQAQRLAARLLREAGPDPERQIDLAYSIVFSRPARLEEKRFVLSFLTEQRATLLDRLRARLPVELLAGVPDSTDPATAAALADFCLALLNSNEFVYVR